MRKVVLIEAALDAKLQDRRQVAALDLSFVAVAQDWAQAVWDAAQTCGTLRIGPDDLNRGLALAERPVFICGVHRSGTTLLRDRLDGHPQLAVLPSESGYYTRYDPGLRRMEPAEKAAFLCRTWLQRLANPINQPPFWLLGRSEAHSSDYVRLARAFAGWWPRLQDQAGTPSPSSPLTAFALSYAGVMADRMASPPVRSWVDKTPLSEEHLDRIWADFPAAKILHLVRRPDAVLSSHKELVRRAGNRDWRAAPVIRDLNLSYAIALDRSRRGPADLYCLVRYEDLVAQPGPTMERISRFLGIKPSPALVQPSVAGRPATNNSSFASGRDDPAFGLSASELDRLAFRVGDQAARLGYDGIAPATALGRLVHKARRLLPRRPAITRRPS